MAEETWSPAKLFQVSGSYWNGFALHAGVKLDIFSLIGNERLSAGEVAQRLMGDERATAALLNVFVAMGLLLKNEEKFENTPESRELLTRTSSKYVGHAIMHHHHLVPAWHELSEVVKSGNPVRRKDRSEVQLESFLMGMCNIAMAIAPVLAEQIDLSGRNRLLDLGGGPGTYAIHFCLSNPSLQATVFDLHATRPFAVKTMERFRLADRIRFESGDYLEDEIRGPYDVVWLSHILHAHGPEKCRMIIHKAASVLEPGGLLLLHDFILSDTKDSPLFPALFALNMLVNTKEGRTYSEGEIMEMLSEAGIQEIKRLPFRGPNDSTILSGVRPV